jgi:serine-type D-Ala-D-Ala carboxypeptidase/endopeptidase (penicillin-binding protein 4)
MTARRAISGVLTAVILLAAGKETAFAQGFREDTRTPAARDGSQLAARKAISRDRLRRMLENQMDSVGGASGAYVYDTDANSHRLIYSDSGSNARILASNSKLFTTAAYLEKFGGNGRLETRVFARGRRTGGRQRTLKGSLVLVGDGDPALAQAGFAQARHLPLTSLGPLAQAVKDAGIRRVRGKLVADPTIFDGARSVPMPGVSADPGDLPTLSGLSFNRGMQNGGYARSPARNAAGELIAELKERGIRVTRGVKVDGVPDRLFESDPLGAVRSPPAKAFAKQTNTPSDNFYAEMLLKRIGSGPNKRGTTARGASRTEAFARQAGSGVNLVNGSGLARANTASPKNVAALLTFMRKDDTERSAFYESLAVAGKTGTLSRRMRNTAAEGSCHAKTGTIDGVSALSGYCRAGAGQVAFSILMNNVSISAAQRAQDAMAAAIARYR